MSGRATVLGKVRQALTADAGDPDRRAVVTERLGHAKRNLIPERGQLDAEGRATLFCAMAEAVQASVTRLASPADVPAAIAEHLRQHNLPAQVRMGADPRLQELDWSVARSVEIRRGPSDGRDMVAVSHAFAGVAETGTLVLLSGADNPTTLNFLPDTHIVVLAASDIAGDYETVFDRVRVTHGKHQMPRTLNMVTGPSRSADIEQTLILGAHGPRALTSWWLADVARPWSSPGEAGKLASPPLSARQLKTAVIMETWQIAPARQPRREDYAFDLDAVLSSVVGVRTLIPAEAFTAETLGTERAGSGVVFRDGLVLTIGYLLTEAEEVWITTSTGAAVPGHPLAYDQVTGFGIIQALAPLPASPLPLGHSAEIRVGSPVVVAGMGGRKHALAAKIAAKQEFAGYWEYVLDEAIFTTPAHPFWGGAAVIGPAGDVIGIGSLQLEQAVGGERAEQLNMIVPIDLLHPILDDLLSTGQADRPPRPWLGLFATEMDDRIYVAGVSSGGPAEKGGLRPGDLIVAVAGRPVSGLADLFRAIWAVGDAGVDVPLAISREGQTLQVSVKSSDRGRHLKAPRMHS